MEKPSEEYIENYVRYPSDLSTKEKLWIEEWIQKDCEIRLLADWFREFYEVFDEVEKSKTSYAGKPDYIKLEPFSFEEEKSDSNSKDLFTEISTFQSKRLVQTFLSKKNKTLIRILYDDEDRLYKLHIISEFVDKDDIVLIKIPENDTFLMGGPGESIPIPGKISPDNIREWPYCELYLPLSKIHVYRDKRTHYLNIDSRNLDSDTSSIDLKVINHQAEITIHSGDQPTPQKMALHSDKESILWTLENGSCSIPVKKISTSGSILFFFR